MARTGQVPRREPGSGSDAAADRTGERGGAPRAGPLGLAVDELVVLVDEEALGLDDLGEAMVTEPVADAARGASGEERRGVDPRVEGRGRRALTGTNVAEPVAKPFAF